MTKTTFRHLLDILAEGPDSRNNPGLFMVDFRITLTLCIGAECKAKTNFAAYGQNLETLKKHPSKNPRS